MTRDEISKISISNLNDKVRLSNLANRASLVLSLLNGLDGESVRRVCTGNSLSRDRARESSIEDVPRDVAT